MSNTTAVSTITRTIELNQALGVSLTLSISHVGGVETAMTATITKAGKVVAEGAWRDVQFKLSPEPRKMGNYLDRSLYNDLVSACPELAAALKADRADDDLAADIARQEGCPAPRYTLSRSTVSA